MSLQERRPLHLRHRQTRQTYGVSAELVREVGAGRNEFGEWIGSSEVRMRVTLATAPTRLGIERMLAEGDGIRLGGMRDFWLDRYDVDPEAISFLPPRSGDRIIYDQVWYRITVVSGWDAGFFAITAAYEDPQPH